MAEERKYLTEEELKRFLGVIKPAQNRGIPDKEAHDRAIRDRAIFTVMYWRGLRRSEVGMLQLASWRQEAGRLFVVRKKGSESGEYLLSPAEQKALKAWVRIRGQAPGPLFPSRTGKGISGVMCDVLMKDYGERANLPADLRHCHVLKHSLATHLVGRDVELFAIKDWVGHTDIKSTMVYSRFRSKQRDAIANKIYGSER